MEIRKIPTSGGVSRIVALLLLTLVTFGVSAKFSIYNFSGKVSVVNKRESKLAAKGMELQGLDEVVIAPDSYVEIINSVDSKVYRCDKPGRFTATKIMLNATKSANSSFGNVNKTMRFAKADNQSKVYTEGCRVTRALEVFDPEASSVQVDAVRLATSLAGALKQSCMSDSLPVTVTFNGGDEPFEFSVENTLDFPIYVNIVKCSKTEPGKVAISEMGQPVGCYTLLPGQAMMRRHNAALPDDEVHVMMLAYCYFDIDGVIEKATELLLDSDNDTNTIDNDLYIIKLNNK